MSIPNISLKSIVSSLAVIAFSLADEKGCNPSALGTVTPCPDCDPITITKQNQPVSTLIPKGIVCANNGSCTTEYNTKSYDWISAIMPQAQYPYYRTVSDADERVTISSMMTNSLRARGILVPRATGTPSSQSGAMIRFDTVPFRDLAAYHELIGETPESLSQHIRSCLCPEDFESEDECECHDYIQSIQSKQETGTSIRPGQQVVINQHVDKNGPMDIDVGGGIHITIIISNAPGNFVTTTFLPNATVTTTTTVYVTGSTNTDGGSSSSSDGGGGDASSISSSSATSGTASAPAPTSTDGTGGANFILEVSGSTQSKARRGLRHRHKQKRQMTTGFLGLSDDKLVVVSNKNEAATLSIDSSGHLKNNNGDTITVSSSDVNTGNAQLLFGGSGNISTVFSVGPNNFLLWSNSQFPSMTAAFCIDETDNAFAIFGSSDPDFKCDIVNFIAADVSSSPSSLVSGSSSPTTSTSPSSAATTSASRRHDDNSSSDTITISGPLTTSSSQTASSSSLQTENTSTTSSAAAPSSSGDGSVAQEALSLHNSLRAQHNVPAMTYSDTLAAYAQNYASGCNFEHSPGSYGENLAAGYDSASEAIQAWYDEISLYDYDNPMFSEETGHFTQVVWKGSKSLGCAQVECSELGLYLVCEYDPAGNVIGDFEANVLRRTDGSNGGGGGASSASRNGTAAAGGEMVKGKVNGEKGVKDSVKKDDKKDDKMNDNKEDKKDDKKDEKKDVKKQD